MSTYAKGAPKRSTGAHEPVIPTRCDVFGCQTLRNPKTNEHTRGNADVIINANGRLIARCSDHYLDDLYRSGNGRWSDIARTDRVSMEDVAAYVPNPAWEAIGTKAQRETGSGAIHVGRAVKAALEGAA